MRELFEALAPIEPYWPWASLKSFRRKDGGDVPPGPGRNGEKEFRRT